MSNKDNLKIQEKHLNPEEAPGFKVVEFKSGKAQDLERFKEVFGENLEKMQKAMLVWEDGEHEVYYCGLNARVSEIVGLLEMAKHYVIAAHVWEEE